MGKHNDKEPVVRGSQAFICSQAKRGKKIVKPISPVG